MLCTLGLGLLVSTLARTQQQAMMITTFVFMMPQIYLSGFIFPIQNMPEVFQLVTYVVPLRYYVQVLRGVFLKGVGLDVLWPQGLAMLARRRHPDARAAPLPPAHRIAIHFVNRCGRRFPLALREANCYQ